jgi:ABC-type Zn uptake system ZnuABC Zn-binding protein ZnuA
MMQSGWFNVLVVMLLSIGVWVSGCATQDGPAADEGSAPALPAVSLAPGEQLQVVATTSIVADVVRQVGQDKIKVTMLMPLGADPHTFEPSPRDVASVADADVVFGNGAGLEDFLDTILESAGAADKVVFLSAGIDLLEQEAQDEHDDEEHEHQADPHTWTDPNNVIVWVDNIEHALSVLDPENAATFGENAEVYRSELVALDQWVRAEVANIPEERRQIVTDHQLFRYFVDKYGFTQVGAIVPGYSTVAEPSARELAQLEEAIQELDVPAVFVGNTVNPTLAERVAEDTGSELVFLYTGSLTEPGGVAGTYIDYIRYNVSAIVHALE